MKRQLINNHMTDDKTITMWPQYHTPIVLVGFL